MSGRRAEPSGDDPDLEGIVTGARGGDAGALEALVDAIQDGVYGLALRMTGQRADAEDATQEILVKVLTRLDSYRGDAAVRTWVYRIAVNHLLDRRKTAYERARLGFGDFGADLRDGLADPATEYQPEAVVLAEEVKLSCTLGMLQCLDRNQRIAYILGEVFGTRGDQAADILEVSPAAYRKRLSRARDRLRDFMNDNCGLVDPDNRCRCDRRINRAIELGRVDRDQPQLATHPRRTKAATREMDLLYDAAAVMRSHPDYAAPERSTERLRALLAADNLELLDDS